MSYTYTLKQYGVERSDGASIPNDPLNGHWQQFLQAAVDAELITKQDMIDNIIPVVDDVLVFLEPPRPVADVQQEAYYMIDAAAENARLRYITGGAGQAQTYQEKSEEAADYVAAGYPADTSNYPFVQADANAYGSTPTDAADYILLKRSEWVTLGAAIEELRLGGKKGVFDALITDTIETVRDAAIAALDLI